MTTDNPSTTEPIADGGNPIPPESVPKYVREGVENQDVSTLREIAVWSKELADYREQRPIEVDEDEELVEVGEDDDDGPSGTPVIKKVPCGKECDGCPHGPYEYRVTREGKNHNWEYIGPVDE